MNEDNKVQIPKKENNNDIQKQLDKMQEIIDAQQDKIGLLTQVADKGRLSRLQNPEKQPLLIKLNLFDGKVVMKWKLLENYVKVKDKEVIENQVVEYEFKGGQTVQMSYLDSVYKTYKEQVAVKKVSESSDGFGEKSIVYTVDYNGETYEIDSKYIN